MSWFTIYSGMSRDAWHYRSHCLKITKTVLHTQWHKWQTYSKAKKQTLIDWILKMRNWAHLHLHCVRLRYTDRLWTPWPEIPPKIMVASPVPKRKQVGRSIFEIQVDFAEIWLREPSKIFTVRSHNFTEGGGG